MVRLILVRHGFSLGNKEKKFTGQRDVPLAEEGIVQAQRVSEYIFENYKVDAIYSSDLQRTCNTVAPLAQKLGLQVKTHPGLREIDVGEWAGLCVEDRADEFKLYVTRPKQFRFDGGESGEELVTRVSAALDEIERDNEGKTVVIGTHGGVIHRMCAAWSGVFDNGYGDLKAPGNASVTLVDYNTGHADIISYSFNGYLDTKADGE